MVCSSPNFSTLVGSDLQGVLPHLHPGHEYAVTEQVRSYCLYAHGFRIYFTPLPGFFSPFPHGTGSLSVDYDTTGPISHTGLSPTMAPISRGFCYRSDYHVQALPISLAATLGISVDFFSCSYLDGGLPHSEICGSKCVCSLPAAYRKLLRPSSPVIAKASTMCTY
eukprot:gene4491-5267_t